MKILRYVCFIILLLRPVSCFSSLYLHAGRVGLGVGDWGLGVGLGFGQEPEWAELDGGFGGPGRGKVGRGPGVRHGGDVARGAWVGLE